MPTQMLHPCEAQAKPKVQAALKATTISLLHTHRNSNQPKYHGINVISSLGISNNGNFRRKQRNKSTWSLKIHRPPFHSGDIFQIFAQEQRCGQHWGHKKDSLSEGIHSLTEEKYKQILMLPPNEHCIEGTVLAKATATHRSTLLPGCLKTASQKR